MSKALDRGRQLWQFFAQGAYARLQPMDASSQPPDRLRDEEIHFVRPGNSREVESWNREYALLVAEYLTALDQQDEGWASERVAEIRKCLGGFKRADTSLGEAAGQEFQKQQETFWIAYEFVVTESRRCSFAGITSAVRTKMRIKCCFT